VSLGQTISPSEQGNHAFIPGAVERRGIATRFEPGKSGNPGGRPRTAKFRKLALKHLNIVVAEGTKQADCVMDAIVQKAIGEGDVPAASFLRDVVDGKPGSNDANAGPTHVSIEIVMVGQ